MGRYFFLNLKTQVRELKEMWSSEEEYDKWRTVNKDEIEPKI